MPDSEIGLGLPRDGRRSRAGEKGGSEWLVGFPLQPDGPSQKIDI